MTPDQIATKADIAKLFDQMNLIRNEIKQITTPSTETKYIDRKEVCELLNLSLSSVDKYAREGVFPSYKIGGKVKFKKAEIEASLTNIHQAKYQRKEN